MSEDRPASGADHEVIVVGAGLTGLCCARRLHEEGVEVLVLEASDAVGGRVRTDEIGGFLLDRGFQVLLTAYEEVRSQVDLQALDVRAFDPGSLVWKEGDFQRLADPWRKPSAALASARAKVGSMKDKLKVAAYRRQLLRMTPEECLAGPDRSTLQELQEEGFSDDFIQGFFRPFLSGVFLEGELETSARLFRYYFRCFADGDSVVPARGMQRLPEQLAAALRECLTLNAPIEAVTGGSVVPQGGDKLTAERVVLAVDGRSAAELLGEQAPEYKAGLTTYFRAPAAPIDEPILVLDGEGRGPVNHFAVMSSVSPEYAPEGEHLIAVSAVGGFAEGRSAFESASRAHLRDWIGAQVDDWELLQSYEVADALPRHLPGSLDDRGVIVREDGLVVAGDYTEFGAIQGAMLSGRKAAEAILAGG